MLCRETIKFDEVPYGNDDTAASLAVSDQRVVVAQFSTNLDDDLEGDWNTNTGIDGAIVPNPADPTTREIRITSVIVTLTVSDKKCMTAQ